MPRVCPEPPPNPVNCPNTCIEEPPRTRYRDVSRCSRDREVFLNFEGFCDEGTGAEEKGYGGGDDMYEAEKISPPPQHETRRHHHHHHKSKPPPPPTAAPSAQQVSIPMKVPDPETEPAKSFCQCDCVAALIIVAYILAIVITVIGFWCYAHDSYWNGIVHRENSFGKLEGESFFAEKYLYLYENGATQLQNAKGYLLRDNRILETIHLIFFVCFLIFGFFQWASYVTRGKENHTKMIVMFYSIFGGLGLIISLFPLLSWNAQAGDYQLASHSLHEVSEKIFGDSQFGKSVGITNATGHDALTLSKIMAHCRDAATEAVQSDEDTGFIMLYQRKYTTNDLQQLGFCTHHKFKITNTIISFVFACVCCVIPCVYCFGDSNPENLKKKGGLITTMTVKQSEMKPATGIYQPQPSEMQPVQKVQRHHHHHRRKESGESARQHIINHDEIAKFKSFVEGAGSEEDNVF